MKPLFRVVGGLDLSARRDSKQALAEARKRARPILREWLWRVEHHVLAGCLAPLDLMMAKELTNYPSANEGRCYAGQTRLGAAVGSCARTARSSLKRLCAAGLLISKRGGSGRTSAWYFCVNGVPVFGGTAGKVAAQDRQHLSGLDRQHVADKPSEPDPIIQHNLPPTPEPVGEAPAKGLSEEASEAGEATSIDAEVIGGTITFAEFWLAAGRRGLEGFARSQWRKLDDADKAAISDQLSRDGRLQVRGMWAGSWLRDRVWEEAPVAEHTVEPPPRRSHENVYAMPGSDLWRAERRRLLAAGANREVKLMDDFAWLGKGITVMVPNT